MRSHILAPIAAALAFASFATAQSILPAVFVANNVGDNVGIFTVNPDGTLFNRGAVPAGDGPQAISLSPDGRYLAVANGTASTTTEELRIFRVNSDASLTPLLTGAVDDSPLDIAWTGNDTLAVTETRLSGGSDVRNYRYTEAGNLFTSVGVATSGGFNTRIDVDHNRRVVYAQDTTTDVIRAIRINPDGSLATFDTEPSPPGMVGVGISPTGNQLVGTTGALASGGRQISTFPVDGTGALSQGQSIQSPEQFPDGIAFSADGRIVFVGHNDDENVVSFFLDDVTGVLTETGNIFNVGDTLSQGELDTLGDLLFVLDESSTGDNRQGINVLRFNVAGAMTPIDFEVTGGARPMDLSVWRGVPEPTGVMTIVLIGIGALTRRRRRG